MDRPRESRRLRPNVMWGSVRATERRNDRAPVGSSVARALDDDRELDYEFRIVRPDGSVRWIADQGRVVRDAAGAVTGGVIGMAAGPVGAAVGAVGGAIVGAITEGVMHAGEDDHASQPIGGAGDRIGCAVIE